LAAIYGALAKPTSEKDGEESADDIADREWFADRATDTLRSAVATGFTDVSTLKANKELASIRTRGEFLNIVQALELLAQCEQNARRAQWQKAESCCEQAIAADESSWKAWLALAMLQCHSGRLDAYKESCRRMEELFLNSGHTRSIGTVVQSALVHPDAVSDWNSLSERAEHIFNETAHYGTRLARGVNKGAIEYRAGRYASAIEWLERHRLPESTKDYRPVRASLFLAMAHHRLGHAEEARASLEQARSVMQRHPKLEDGDLGSYWRGWLSCQIVFDEAKRLLEIDE